MFYECTGFQRIKHFQADRSVNALRLYSFVPSKSSVLLSEHFKDEDFDKTTTFVVMVKIPSVFVLLSATSFRKQRHTDHPLQDRHLLNQVHHYCRGIRRHVTSDKTSLKRKLDDTNTKLVSLRKKRKVLFQTRMRLRKRNADYYHRFKDTCIDQQQQC